MTVQGGGAREGPRPCTGLALLCLLFLAACATAPDPSVRPYRLPPQPMSPWLDSSRGRVVFERDNAGTMWLVVPDDSIRYSIDLPAAPIIQTGATAGSRGSVLILRTQSEDCPNRTFTVAFGARGQPPSWQWLGDCGSGFTPAGRHADGAVLKELTRGGQARYWRIQHGDETYAVTPVQKDQPGRTPSRPAAPVIAVPAPPAADARTVTARAAPPPRVAKPAPPPSKPAAASASAPKPKAKPKPKGTAAPIPLPTPRKGLPAPRKGT